MKNISRCDWCVGDPLYEAYHDQEWGRPIFDSRILFEKLCLEAFQAGLSWITILRKREDFLTSFDQFNPNIVAAYGIDKVHALVNNKKIIRHKGKIEATIHNAQCFLTLEKTISFSDFLWQYVGHTPIINHIKHICDIPAKTDLSVRISQDLKKYGFKFCGPVMVYAFMQAVGMVNDHIITCDFYQK